MALTIRVDQASVQRLLRKLGRARALDTLRPPMKRATAWLQRDLAEYPPPSRRPQPPRTERQRRFLHALARRGGIPYRRTGRLGRGWTTRISAQGTNQHAIALTGAVGNTTSYGPLVQGDESQVAYHTGTWDTEGDVVRRHTKRIVDDFREAIDDALD